MSRIIEIAPILELSRLTSATLQGVIIKKKIRPINIYKRELTNEAC